MKTATQRRRHTNTATSARRRPPHTDETERPPKNGPHQDLLAATNVRDVGLDETQLKTLDQLHEKMRGASAEAAEAMVDFAVAYAEACATLRRGDSTIKTLNERYGVSADYAAPRWHTIASQATQLRQFIRCLPATLEPLYEFALAVKTDVGEVRQAIKDGRLMPSPTLREVRALREPVNVIGSALKGQDVHGGPYDSPVSVHGLKNLVFHITFPQERVLRLEEINTFRQKVETALRETFAVRCVEVGVRDDDGDWKGPSDLSRYLGSYWKLMDEADALNRKVEAQAEAVVDARKHMTPIERELALREARQDAWKPFQERKQQIDERFKAVFATVSNTQARRKAVGDE